MKETFYQQDEIKKARKLQEDCVNLHLPSPPLLTYQIDIVNSDGSIQERINSKANSYVRNALNLMAWNVGAAAASLNSSTIGNGNLGIRGYNGDTYTPESSSRKGVTDVELLVGYMDTAENLNDYRISSSVAFDSATTSVFTYFAGDRLYSEITRSFVLPSIYQSATVSAAAIIQRNIDTESTKRNVMIVRDKFAEVTIMPGQSINLKYLIEILYPS